jgi:hypothetical protein
MYQAAIGIAIGHNQDIFATGSSIIRWSGIGQVGMERNAQNGIIDGFVLHVHEGAGYVDGSDLALKDGMINNQTIDGTITTTIFVIQGSATPIQGGSISIAVMDVIIVVDVVVVVIAMTLPHSQSGPYGIAERVGFCAGIGW